MRESSIAHNNKLCHRCSNKNIVTIKYQKTQYEAPLSDIGLEHVDRHFSLWEDGLKPVVRDVSGFFFSGVKNSLHELVLGGVLFLLAVVIVAFVYFTVQNKQHIKRDRESNERIDGNQTNHAKQVMELQNLKKGMNKRFEYLERQSPSN